MTASVQRGKREAITVFSRLPSWRQLEATPPLQTSLIPGGYTSTGEILYIGRKIHKGEMTPGKIYPSHDCLYISYGGDEHCYKDNYEVLISRVRLDCE